MENEGVAEAMEKTRRGREEEMQGGGTAALHRAGRGGISEQSSQRGEEGMSNGRLGENIPGKGNIKGPRSMFGVW